MALSEDMTATLEAALAQALNDVDPGPGQALPDILWQI